MDLDDNPVEGTVEAAPDSDLDLGALANVLDDPEDPDTDEDEATTAADDDPLGDDEADDEDQAGDGDGPSEYANGRWAADNARVKLTDGSTATIKDLKEGFLRQSDYTRKTQEAAELRKAAEAERERFSQTSRAFQERLDQVAWWLDQTKPTRPQGGPSEDIIGYNEYRDQMERWNEANQYWQAQRQQFTQEQQAHQQEISRQTLAREQQELVKAIPVLRDPAKRTAFISEITSVAQDYGVSEQELHAISDHRFFLVLRDAARYRRMKASAPKVRDDVSAKPKLIRGSKRTNADTQASRLQKQRTDRLRTEGTFDAGVAALATLKDL